MNIFTYGRKICKLIGINEENVTDVSLTSFHKYGTDYTGINIKTKNSFIIVPDINNAENVLIYSTFNTDTLVRELYALNYSQRQISGILKICQPTVSKILGKE